MTELHRPPMEIGELLMWAAAHMDEADAIARRWRYAKKRIADHVRDTGPAFVGGKRIEIESSGYEWSESAIASAAELNPLLLDEGTVTVRVIGTKGEMTVQERVREIAGTVMELDHDADVRWDYSIDRTQANRLIAQDGEIGRKLRELRKSKGNLVVK